MTVRGDYWRGRCSRFFTACLAVSAGPRDTPCYQLGLQRAHTQVHEEEDALSMWSPDQHRVEAHKAALGIVTMLALVGGFAYYVTINRPQRKATARDYPYGGLEKELGGYSKAREEPIDDE